VARREPWPEELKHQARTLYERDGIQLAAEVTQIPSRTLRYWARAEQWQHPGSDGNGGNRPDLHVAPGAHAPQPVSSGGKPVKGQVVALGYGFARRDLLRQLADEAAGCLTAMAEDRERGRSAAVRNWAWAVGVLLERAELLAKAAGPGHADDHPDPAEAVGRLRELAADLNARRTGTDGHPS
jgi:hypothetical protein